MWLGQAYSWSSACSTSFAQLVARSPLPGTGREGGREGGWGGGCLGLPVLFAGAALWQRITLSLCVQREQAPRNTRSLPPLLTLF